MGFHREVTDYYSVEMNSKWVSTMLKRVSTIMKSISTVLRLLFKSFIAVNPMPYRIIEAFESREVESGKVKKQKINESR